MNLGIAGKNALVTGGTRGIGFAIAKALADEKVNVALCSRDEKEAVSVAAQISSSTGVKCIGVRADTGVSEDINAMVENSSHYLGGIDILINNAARVGGTGGPDTLGALNEQMLEDDFKVKIMGYLRCAKAVLPNMENSGWGRIINMDGMAARNAAGISGGMRNAAVMNFTKVMSEEIGSKGITVNAVHPAVSKTETLIQRLTDNAKRDGISVEEAESKIASNNAIKRLVTSEEIASVVVFLCSEQAGCITGEAIAPSGGNSRSVFY
ncbi:MAG: SDR family oxidoreductase [SAR202 cluster bacterium]|nr:SDR family oxidoreductase [SAR202 cluster bacterium]|tara:strand:+ start:51149 stop:51949 length:801 start_codon:yes stop_codon:yes gene_type:complete